MKIQAPPGMRDFYPADMRVQNWLFDQWRSASRAFGFEEYEGPIFESLDLYRLKSGEGIVSELFAFRDRGERELAIRPEMTPTLARMVAARASALPRPIKWFSLPRMCRAEKPQKGRLREFFQWNADILGVEEPLADAEVVAVMAQFLSSVGLADDATIWVNSRPLIAAGLAVAGVPAEKIDAAFRLIDRMDRGGAADFERNWVGEVSRESLRAALDLLGHGEQSLREAASRWAGPNSPQAVWLGQFADYLEPLGVRVKFSPRIVRGLSYYTGLVFEVHANAEGHRALAGGGRYDDLTGLLEGPRVPGIGFGMGDAPVLELLRDLNRLPEFSEQVDFFVIDADAALFPKLLNIVSRLRRAGATVDFSYKRQAVGKQFKSAAARGARLALVVGQELEQNQLVLKDLRSSEQRNVDAGTFPDDHAAIAALVSSPHSKKIADHRIRQQ